MIKLIKFIFYAALLGFTFFSGVKYAEPTREIASWLFEAKEKEIDMSDIKKDIKKQGINIPEGAPIHIIEDEIPSESILDNQLIDGDAPLTEIE